MLSTAVSQVHSIGHIEIVFVYVYIYILQCKDFSNRFRAVSQYQFGSIYYLAFLHVLRFRHTVQH